jgi:transcriptional regulatory protein LevR
MEILVPSAWHACDCVVETLEHQELHRGRMLTFDMGTTTGMRLGFVSFKLARARALKF